MMEEIRVDVFGYELATDNLGRAYRACSIVLT